MWDPTLEGPRNALRGGVSLRGGSRRGVITSWGYRFVGVSPPRSWRHLSTSTEKCPGFLKNLGKLTFEIHARRGLRGLQDVIWRHGGGGGMQHTNTSPCEVRLICSVASDAGESHPMFVFLTRKRPARFGRDLISHNVFIN